MNIRWCCAFMILLACISNILLAQHVKEFTYLKEYAGEYASDKVIADKKISPILKKMMGKEYKHLINNISVTGPVDLISGSIVISGNAPHMGIEEMAILDINLYTGIIRAAIYSNGAITIYSDQQKYDSYIDKNKYEHLPVSIKDWISVVNRQLIDRAQKPQNVVIK